jgi:death-on-curing protein
MRYISISEVIELHRRIVDQSGGASGLRDLGGLESAIAQPRMTFGGQDLYPTLIEKAGALCFSLVQNHPFVDGNKRLGHAAMEVFLILNGHEIQASVDEQENLILGVASSQISRDSLIKWLTDHIFEIE